MNTSIFNVSLTFSLISFLSFVSFGDPKDGSQSLGVKITTLRSFEKFYQIVNIDQDSSLIIGRREGDSYSKIYRAYHNTGEIVEVFDAKQDIKAVFFGLNKETIYFLSDNNNNKNYFIYQMYREEPHLEWEKREVFGFEGYSAIPIALEKDTNQLVVKLQSMDPGGRFRFYKVDLNSTLFPKPSELSSGRHLILEPNFSLIQVPEEIGIGKEISDFLNRMGSLPNPSGKRVNGHGQGAIGCNKLFSGFLIQ